MSQGMVPKTAILRPAEVRAKLEEHRKVVGATRFSVSGAPEILADLGVRLTTMTVNVIAVVSDGGHRFVRFSCGEGRRVHSLHEKFFEGLD